jgi:hypothetical protein
MLFDHGTFACHEISTALKRGFALSLTEEATAEESTNELLASNKAIR